MPGFTERTLRVGREATPRVLADIEAYNAFVESASWFGSAEWVRRLA